jgi:hypothetical protein
MSMTLASRMKSIKDEDPSTTTDNTHNSNDVHDNSGTTLLVHATKQTLKKLCGSDLLALVTTAAVPVPQTCKR